MLYSKQTCGFYDREIHRAAIPEDAVEVPEAMYKAWSEGGKRIDVDVKGNLRLVDEPPNSV